MKLSIVSTLYCSSKYVKEFSKRMLNVAENIGYSEVELILVNDGSPDNSLDVALELARIDRRLRVIDLSRNFGHHQALICGLKHATGDRVFMIDSDLEEDPEWLQVFSSEMDKTECESVFGVQAKRKGRLFERISGWLFYRLFNLMTGYDFPKNIVTTRLMTRRFLNSFLLHKELDLSIAGLFFITGYQQVPVVIEKASSSESTYSLPKKFALLVNAVTSFSSKPLVSIFFFGVFVFIFALAVSAYYIVNALVLGKPPSGWTSLMVSTWMLGGLIISCIGIVGIYLSKVYNETKRRPQAIVNRVYESQEEG